MAKRDAELAKKLHAYLTERWDLDGMAEALGAPRENVREVLKARRFMDRVLHDTVQRFDPDFGNWHTGSYREMMESHGVEAASTIVEIMKFSERDDVRLKAAKIIGDAHLPKQHEHTHRPAFITDEQAKMIQAASKEADNLMPPIDVTPKAKVQ